MAEERTKVLEMLAEGKITAEGANEMLEDLKGRQLLQSGECRGRGGWRWLDRLVSAFGAKAEYSEKLDWTLDGAGVSLIDAQTNNGSISLCGSDRDQVTVCAWKKIRAPTESAAEEFARQVQIHVERQENAIRIYKEHPSPPAGVGVAVRYEISAPRAAGANFRTANGSIRIHEIGGAVEAVTVNGGIELQGGAGDVNLGTSNGAIELRDTAGHVRASTSNGRVRAAIRHFEGGVFSTSNGSITVEIREGSAPVAATTANGAIRLTLPADFSGRLDAKTALGRVYSELPLAVSEGSRNRLVGQIGAGGEAVVKLRTLNGRIHLRGAIAADASREGPDASCKDADKHGNCG
jgi:hypothetical protein